MLPEDGRILPGTPIATRRRMARSQSPASPTEPARGTRRWAALACATLLLAAAGCVPVDSLDGIGDEEADDDREPLTAAQKRPRYERMRDELRALGIPKNGYLFGGIANTETGLVMCWSEATWACQGPSSPDCGGGPVIAGAGDGPCSIQEGGLGIFQFDAGTFNQTLAKYGSSVLTVEGQVDHAFDYVVRMVRDSMYTTNAETDAKALAWINNFDPKNATLRDQWIKTVLR